MKRFLNIVIFSLLSLPVFANSDQDYRLKLQQIIQSNNDSDVQLSAIFKANWDYQLSLSPSSATYLGFDNYDDHWADVSEAKRNQIKQSTRKTLWAIQQINPAQLTTDNQLNYQLFLRQLKLNIKGEKFPEQYFVLTQMDGPQRNIPATLNAMPHRKLKDFQNILARLRDLPRYLAQSQRLMRQGLDAGITPARVAMLDVPRQIKALIPEDPMQSPLLKPFKTYPDNLSKKQQQQLTTTAVNLYQAKVKPAWHQLLTFMEKTYLPGANKDIALSDKKNGKAWYQYRIQRETTTSLSPQQIHDLGMKEVQRIRKEMIAVYKETGFKGSFDEFLEYLRTDPRFFYKTPEALLTRYRDIAKRIDGHLPELFSLLPRLPYGVKEIPTNEAKAQTTAYYSGGSLRAGRSGTFFANTYALNTRPKWEMIALTMHEAVPGHHLQISLAQELDGLPEFRKNAGITAFVEGWALYSEQLGYEMKMYQTPYDKFGQLTYEMWRAVRLVVDTGMHSLGWTRQQAIDFFKKNSSKSIHDITVEIDRYIAWPGQALAYKMGQLTISKLRLKAEKQLGNRFDLREFHKIILENGAIPLDILELKVNNWLKQKNVQ